MKRLQLRETGQSPDQTLDQLFDTFVGQKGDRGTRSVRRMRLQAEAARVEAELAALSAPKITEPS